MFGRHGGRMFQAGVASTSVTYTAGTDKSLFGVIAMQTYLTAFIHEIEVSVHGSLGDANEAAYPYNIVCHRITAADSFLVGGSPILTPTDLAGATAPTQVRDDVSVRVKGYATGEGTVVETFTTLASGVLKNRAPNHLVFGSPLVLTSLGVQKPTAIYLQPTVNITATISVNCLFEYFATAHA